MQQSVEKVELAINLRGRPGAHPHHPGNAVGDCQRGDPVAGSRTSLRGPAGYVRLGAGSVIGTEVVSHATPDGNTVLITSTDLLAPQIQKSNYDPLISLEPICYLVTLPELRITLRYAC